MPSIDIRWILGNGTADTAQRAVDQFFAAGGSEQDLVAEMNKVAHEGYEWDMLSRYAYVLWDRAGDLSKLKVPLASILADRGLAEDLETAIARKADPNLFSAHPPALIGVISRWAGSDRSGRPKMKKGKALELVHQMLDAGANPHLAGEWITALGAAAECKDMEVVELLLSRGVDPMQRDSAGYTAMHMAMRRVADADVDATIAVIDRLVAAGADVNALDEDKRTPMAALADVIDPEHASVEGFLRVIDHLKGLGARLSGAQVGRNIALHRAAARGIEALCEALIASGADVEALDSCGRTFVDVAEFNFRRKAASLMTAGRIAKAMGDDPEASPSMASRSPGML